MKRKGMHKRSKEKGKKERYRVKTIKGRGEGDEGKGTE